MTVRGNYLSELRRSNASGIHGHKPSRSALNRAAIEEETLSILDGDYIDQEPADEEIWRLEEEIDPEDFIDPEDDEDAYPYSGSEDYDDQY